MVIKRLQINLKFTYLLHDSLFQKPVRPLTGFKHNGIPAEAKTKRQAEKPEIIFKTRGDASRTRLPFKLGEKLFEEILGAEEGSEPTGIPKIFRARNKRSHDLRAVMSKVEGLVDLCNNSCNREDVVAMLKEIVPSYKPGSGGRENGKLYNAGEQEGLIDSVDSK